jgi:mevalonate pyrophosphate decarboxylase
VVKGFNSKQSEQREARSHFWKSRKEYLKDEFNELETNSRKKNIRNLYSGNSEFN